MYSLSIVLMKYILKDIVYFMVELLDGECQVLYYTIFYERIRTFVLNLTKENLCSILFSLFPISVVNGKTLKYIYNELVYIRVNCTRVNTNVYKEYLMNQNTIQINLKV